MKLPGWRWPFVFVLTVLTACAHMPRHSTRVPPGWGAQQARQKALSSWYVQGRMGVENTKQAGSFDVFWNQQGDRYQIRVLAPIGQGAFMVEGDAQEVMLRLANGEVRTAANADQLLKDSLGVGLPLKSLQNWLRGIPAEGDTELQWDRQGNLFLLRHGQWRVDIERYHKHDGLELPQAFYLTRIDQPDLSVRLLLRKWQLSNLPTLLP